MEVFFVSSRTGPNARDASRRARYVARTTSADFAKWEATVTGGTLVGDSGALEISTTPVRIFLRAVVRFRQSFLEFFCYAWRSLTRHLDQEPLSPTTFPVVHTGSGQ